MVDTLTPAARRALMQRIRRENTEPELVLRRGLHALGLRYRLHPRDLPGRPDLAFVGAKVAVFVHGCFWHAHECPAGRIPSSNVNVWKTKRAANRERDARKERQLREEGWTVVTVWECELKKPADATMTIARVAEQLSAHYAVRRRESRRGEPLLVGSNN